MGIMRLAVIGGAAAIAFSYGAASDKKSTDAAIAKYELTKYETGFMKQCKSAMRKHKVKFAEGAAQTEGCACSTSKLSNSLSQKQLKPAGEILDVVFYIGKNKKKKNLYRWSSLKFEKVKKNHRLSNTQFKRVMDSVFTSLKQCGKRV